MTVNKNGITKNLRAQVEVFFDNCNVGSYASRDRNKEACFRFADFLGENTHLQKMKNVEARHVYDYVDL